MRSFSFALLLLLSPMLPAAGLLIPEDKKIPPLALVSHHVSVAIDDQVAVTGTEQIFRNHTDRPLEATYIFPVPKGASLDKFTMWIDGKETHGELLDAKKASQIYTDIVRRTQDPGLLEYIGQDLLRMRIFPVPARGDVKVKLRFVSVAVADHGLIEYTYPMRTDGKATRTLDDFSVKLTLKSQHAISSIYSPTHAVNITRPGSRDAVVEFEKKQSLLDKDFQLFYTLSDRDVGLTPIIYRPVSSDDGYFMLLISPDMEATRSARIARDFVMVLDTSGSMSEVKMNQARKALKHCLNNLGPDDRFALVSFATTVRTFNDDLCANNMDNLERANKWVDDLRQSGGTAILPALQRAIDFRPKTSGRPFTLVFFTDGMPTVDETDPVKIVKAVSARNNADTRIFTFGVGDDVNAAMLDQLSDSTRAASTYVRPSEDIEAKVSSLHNKISKPVLTNVKLTATNVRFSEIYPPSMPDLFYGSQLVVLGRYSGHGPAVIKLTGMLGSDAKEYVYEFDFPARTTSNKSFVEHLWARRKVGFILDQIRANGEQKELVEEATKLAKKYGIATPYTSYLVVPDAPVPVAERGRGSIPNLNAPLSLNPGNGAFVPAKAPAAQVATVNASAAPAPGGGGLAGQRGAAQDKALDERLKEMKPEEVKGDYAKALEKARKDNFDNLAAGENYKGGKLLANQAGRLGVELAVASDQLRNQQRISITANRMVQGRNCVEISGVWIDDAYTAKTETVKVKAQSDAYFKLLDKHPEIREVLVLGNQIVWITPSGKALIIDSAEGSEKIEDREIDTLFTAKK